MVAARGCGAWRDAMSRDGFIGVVCGLKSEAAAMRGALGDDARIRVGVSGANARRAEDIARRFCAEGARAIVSVGVSGGLDPALKPGDLIIGVAVVAADGAVAESDAALLETLHADYLREGGDRVSADVPDSRFRGNGRETSIFGRLFGADDIIDSAEAKAALFSEHKAVAVDMESHGCARAAAEAGVAFLAIRAVADPAGRALPLAALGAVAPDGSTRVFKTLGAALRDPRQFPALMKLGEDSAAATKTLRRDLGPVFRSLFTALGL